MVRLHSTIIAHLRYQPANTSKSRIKQLRGLSRPQYRLRVDEVRVYYDVIDTAVEILAIVPKDEAVAWFEQAGELDENSTPE